MVDALPPLAPDPGWGWGEHVATVRRYALLIPPICGVLGFWHYTWWPLIPSALYAKAADGPVAVSQWTVIEADLVFAGVAAGVIAAIGYAVVSTAWIARGEKSPERVFQIDTSCAVMMFGGLLLSLIGGQWLAPPVPEAPQVVWSHGEPSQKLKSVRESYPEAFAPPDPDKAPDPEEAPPGPGAIPRDAPEPELTPPR